MIINTNELSQESKRILGEFLLRSFIATCATSDGPFETKISEADHGFISCDEWEPTERTMMGMALMKHTSMVYGPYDIAVQAVLFMEPLRGTISVMVLNMPHGKEVLVNTPFGLFGTTETIAWVRDLLRSTLLVYGVENMVNDFAEEYEYNTKNIPTPFYDQGYTEEEKSRREYNREFL